MNPTVNMPVDIGIDTAKREVIANEIMPKDDMPAYLPDHLSERVRVLKAHPPERGGSYVLYWMHHAVRAQENPALDAALWMGNHWGLPVLVYQGLSGYHPYNSDRHHTFIMEGARDVQQALAARNIAYAFHLGRDPKAPGPLLDLCENAALVITEDYPAPPFPGWYQRISENIRPGFWAVDASCIVPMQSLNKSYPRAFQFREQTKQEFERRIQVAWETIEPTVSPYAGPFDFEPVDFNKADLAALCAACEIDHSIGPVHHTEGGSTAGYQRWALFKAYGLKSYPRLRNDATQQFPKGVSRLSPYLHHGHVAPFRIAREARESGGAGAEKFLDELLIWRELAYNFCFHHDDVASLNILPGWARTTLRAHASDPRGALYSWDQLAHGKTGNALWDTAQQSLLVHGELHNNVRMTWGKAILQWTKDPETALGMLIDLNHRYALDGSDPNSYAGLLWCLGLLDRPFSPEIPIYGSVRPRSTEDHTKRINMDQYTAHVNRSNNPDQLSVAIVGAGFTGLNAGRTLMHQGFNVHLFDKSRGAGGRMASRKTDTGTFDHGAQYFTVRDARFQRYVDAWHEEGLVQPWEGNLGTIQDGMIKPSTTRIKRYVGTPRMSALTRHLSGGLDIQFNTRIQQMERVDNQWRLTDSEGADLGTYDVVLVTTPPSQAIPLLAEVPDLARQVENVSMSPTWAVMVAFEHRLNLAYDGLFFNDAPLSWAARNSSKPERNAQESWVLHGSADWSAENLEADKEEIADQLLAHFFERTQLEAVSPTHLQAHRWRFALADDPLNAGCLWDEELRVGVCGDWCMQSRVEGAFLSGMAGAGRVLSLSGEPVSQPIGLQASLF